MAAILLMALIAVPAAATTTEVDCRSGADLQAAIDASAAGDTLLIRGICVGNFEAGQITLRGKGIRPTLRGTAQTEPVLLAGGTTLVDLTVRGSAGGGIDSYGVTLIRSVVRGNAGHGIRGNAVLDHSTVRDNGGAGLVQYDLFTVGPLVVRYSTISGNGGVGYRVQSKLGNIIHRSTISDNAGGGIETNCGGIWKGIVEVTDSVIRGNRGTRGGGIINGGWITLKGSIVEGNTASEMGGGIYSFCQGHLTVVDSRIKYNRARSGGGIYYTGETGAWGTANMTLSGTSIRGNRARDGGGVYIVVGDARITRSTLSQNTARVNGGGIYNGGWLDATRLLVQGNEADRGGGIFNDGTIDLTRVHFRNNTPNGCTGC